MPLFIVGNIRYEHYLRLSKGMETIKIAFDLTSTDYSAELDFTVMVDDQLLFDIAHVKEKTPVKLSIDVNEGDHELKFMMKNKKIEHTIIDHDNNIIKDACLNINNFSIDNIELKNLFIENTKYYHSYNSDSEKIEHEFYGTMGCNGTIVLKFNAPIYIWFLEIM